MPDDNEVPHGGSQPEPLRGVPLIIDTDAGRTGGPVGWVGMGPLSNLATVVRNRPDLSERLAVYPSTIQHDALTLSAAPAYPFVDFDFEHARVDDIGRMTRDPHGIGVYAGQRARYPAFMQWLDEHLRFVNVSSVAGGGPPGGGAPR